MIIASTRKTTWATPSISASTGWPARRCAFSEKPNSSDSSSTGNTSPCWNAPSIVSGITLSPNATSARLRLLRVLREDARIEMVNVDVQAGARRSTNAMTATASATAVSR